MSSAFPLGKLRTQRLIGRVLERRAIQSALLADGTLCIVYVIGQGGIGKSRLLEAIRDEIVPGLGTGTACRWGKILDLYFVQIEKSSGLERAIMDAVDPRAQGFSAYREERERYEALRLAGGSPRELESLRAKLRGLFIAGFNEISTQVRPVVCLDTMERIQYEADVVQEIAGIKHPGLEVWDWLLDVLPRLRNAVIVLAGRPHPILWGSLQAHYASTLGAVEDVSARSNLSQPVGHVQIELGPLTESEVGECLGDLAALNPRIAEARLTANDCAYVHQVTGGQPLRLAFVSTLIANGGLGGGWNAQTIDRDLIGEIQRLTGDTDLVLPLVAWMRKGINAPLLEDLLRQVRGIEWEDAKYQQVLDYLKELPFVKTRPGSDQVFLHDEMYALMDQHVLRAPGYAQDKTKVCEIAQAYYQEAIDQAQGSEKQDLAVDRLYYQLLASPQEGFNQYRLLSDQAIMAHQVGFDMSLRDEVLRFFRERYRREPPPQVIRDGAVRWVKRYIALEDYAVALDVAGRIERSDHAALKPLAQTPDQVSHFGAALLTYKGEALLYLGRNREATAALEAAIERLEPVEPGNEYERQDKALVLGRAYNDLGYIRSRERHFADAIVEYERALDYLEPYPALWADTRKNEALSQAGKGELLLARAYAQEAEDKFRALGMEYSEALALNTRGLIELQTGESREAEILCGEALSIFQRLGDQRGEGLAAIALGWALRKKGGLAPIHTSQVDEAFQEAERFLNRAIEVFRRIDEPARRMEAYGQLGCVYRDQANLYRRMHVHEGQIRGLEEKAHKNLQHSIELAEQHGMTIERADRLEDLAEVYLNWREFGEAAHKLDESDALIPDGYAITRERGLPSPQDPDSSMWYLLGKNGLLRGRIAFEQEKYEEAVEQCMLAYSYFGLYSRELIEQRYSGWTSGARRILNYLLELPRERLESLQETLERVAQEYGTQGTPGTKEMEHLLSRALQATGSRH
jgi:tetratricopeptide (TPR) repeat protein